jgi:hypothetical protein
MIRDGELIEQIDGIDYHIPRVPNLGELQRGNAALRDFLAMLLGPEADGESDERRRHRDRPKQAL